MISTGRRFGKTLATQQTIVDLFNRAAPIGTSVVVTKDDGSQVPTRTRSEAWIPEQAGRPYAVIFLEGISGYYLLSRVRIA